MDTFSESDFSELKKEHDDLVEQNRLAGIRLEQGVNSILESDAEIEVLCKQQEALLKQEEANLKREEALLKRINELEGFLELFKSIENVKQIALVAQEDRAFLKEELSFTRAERAALRDAAVLEEEEEDRSAKRPRV